MVSVMVIVDAMNIYIYLYIQQEIVFSLCSGQIHDLIQVTGA